MNIELNLKSLKRRIRLLLIERHALMGGAVGAGIAAVMVLLSRWFYMFGEPWLLTSVVGAGILAGILWGALRKLTYFATARAAEKRLELKERLSSAVSLSDIDDDMVRALVDDAGQHVQGVRPKDVFPHRFNREMAVFAAALAVLFGLYFIPRIPALQSPERREEVKVMKQEGAKLKKLAKEALKEMSPDNKEIGEQIAHNMERLGKKLESGRMTRKQAILEVRKLEREIKDAQDRIASRNMSPKSMAKAVEDLKDLTPGMAGKMQERIEQELAKARAEGKSDKELKDLQERLKDLQSTSGEPSSEQMQQMEKELQEYLQSQKGVPVPLELAAVMAELLKNEDYKKASELLSQLSQKLAKSGKLSEMDAENLEEQLKALAEALKDTDLDELAKKLREAAEQLAKMDPEELAKMLEEAAKAAEKCCDLAQLGKMGGG